MNKKLYSMPSTAPPSALPPGVLTNRRCRSICYTDLDRNGHINNTRYLDWIDDLLPSAFHRDHQAREFIVCYYSEGKEGQELELQWDMLQEDMLQMDAHRTADGKTERVFSARILYR